MDLHDLLVQMQDCIADIIIAERQGNLSFVCDRLQRLNDMFFSAEQIVPVNLLPGILRIPGGPEMIFTEGLHDLLVQMQDRIADVIIAEQLGNNCLVCDRLEGLNDMLLFTEEFLPVIY